MTAVKKKRKSKSKGHRSPTHRAALFQSFISGLSFGLAAGFALWVFLVPLSGVSYHMGTVTKMPRLTEATGSAGIQWILCSTGGAAVGGIFSLIMILVKKRLLSVIDRLSIASVGIYALASRGLWGTPPQTEREVAQTIVSGITSALPMHSWLFPMILTLFAVLLLGYLEGRFAPSKDSNNLSQKGILPAHFCMSLVAAHITLQLPYYVSRSGDFFAGLRDIIFLLIGY